MVVQMSDKTPDMALASDTQGINDVWGSVGLDFVINPASDEKKICNFLVAGNTRIEDMGGAVKEIISAG